MVLRHSRNVKRMRLSMTSPTQYTWGVEGVFILTWPGDGWHFGPVCGANTGIVGRNISAIGQSTEHAHYNPRHVYSPVSVVQWSVATVTTALEGTSGAHNGEEISPSVLWRE